MDGATGTLIFMNRLREIRDKKGLTLAELADLVGTSHATISRLEAGKMQMTEQWARKLSIALNVAMADLFGEVVQVAHPGLTVLGEVQAGIWRETEVADEPKHPPLPIMPDPLYSSMRQFALKVRGESMNRVVRDGAYIVCVSWAELGREPKDNDLVVVERRKGGMVETTVKRIRLQKDKIILMPDSDDERWQTPLTMGGGPENEEVAILALVVGKYERLS